MALGVTRSQQVLCFALALALLCPGAAQAERRRSSEPSFSDHGGGPSSPSVAWLSRHPFLLDTGRVPWRRPRADAALIQVHGEYQVRLGLFDELRLLGADGRMSELGQTTRLSHWFRLTPRIDYLDELSLIAQADLLGGFFAGQETIEVSAAEQPFDQRNPFDADARWLYLEWRQRSATLRIGQQPAHFGLGLVDNDGNHPSLFGDYAGGDRMERVSVELTPFGPRGALRVLFASDLVFKDEQASLVAGDLAQRSVVGAEIIDAKRGAVGLYAIYRFQAPERAGAARFDQPSRSFVLDSSGAFNTELPGHRGRLFGGYEVALVLGRASGLSSTLQEQRIQGLGAVARLGTALTSKHGNRRFGRVVLTLEWGWASGDADPSDDVQSRFDFDPNFNVGLLLFDHVLSFKTARAATVGRDRRLFERDLPEARKLASNGSVFGATYLYPTVVFRPHPDSDIKLGAVVAQATTDFVDPVLLQLDGDFENFDGGAADSRDLGLELDLGVEQRFRLERGLGLAIGVQGAVLFPGHAFDDAAGGSLGTQYLGMGRFGLQL